MRAPCAQGERVDGPSYAGNATRRYATLTFMRGALVALAVSLIAGVLGVLHYIPALSLALSRVELNFTSLRPIHTTFTSAWIFLGGVAVVHRYLQDCAPTPGTLERWRLRVQVTLWALAGLGMLVTLSIGMTSGREYMGFHPIFSVLILGGWLLFAWNFFAATHRGFWSRPVYVTMWGVGALFFIYTFIEQHAWLIPRVFDDPIVDLRVQWKATGTLVGSFNLFVYGSAYYIGEKLSGNKEYAHSKLAYALFFVSLLNSFTNFGHHTYHLPQSEVVKWISFTVSMTEIIILARVLWDIAALIKLRSTGSQQAARFFFGAARWWTAAMLVSAVLISIPPLNSLIHGTHAVTAHAMGTEIGIDSMILFACVSWLLTEICLKRGENASQLNGSGLYLWAIALNVSVAAMVVWLNLSGIVVGVTRYMGDPPPAWLVNVGPFVFAAAGTCSAFALAGLLRVWLRCAFGRTPSTDQIELREIDCSKRNEP